MLLVMTVVPGFGGQKFMADMMHKLQEARTAIDSMSRDIWLQVDGGIAMETIAVAAAAGADAFVAGSGVYKAETPAVALQQLRKLATQAASLE
jgi:ribulose-phosphate 3-epimerase